MSRDIEARLNQIEDDIAALINDIADIRRNLARLRKAPAIYTQPEYEHEEPTGS